MSGGELWEADAAFNGQGLWGLVRGFGFWATRWRLGLVFAGFRILVKLFFLTVVILYWYTSIIGSPKEEYNELHPANVNANQNVFCESVERDLCMLW